MSYRIEYDSSVGKYEVRPVRSRFFSVLVMVIAALMLAALLRAPQGLAALRTFLIPGEDSITLHAFQCMTTDLHNGASLYEAIYDFCRIVIHEG